MSTLPDVTFVQQRGSPSPETDIRSTTGVDNLAASWAAQGIQSTTLRPVLVKWRGDIYIAGSYTRILVRPILDGVWVAGGIKPPNIQLSVVPGSGSGGSSGACLTFITFLHKAGDVVLAESARSNVVDVGELTGEGRLWTNIALTGEERVTHVRGYVSMNGAGYRMAWEAQIGISSVEENIPTARLSLVGPDIGENNIPPFGVHFAHSWAGRMFYANNPEFPYRLWISDPGNPQSVRPASFRDTADREEITAIWKGRNELLVFCIRACYILRQFGNGINDFVLEKLDSDVGCLTHFGIFEIHNRLWFPSEDGIWIYDGGFHYAMKDLRLLWQQEYSDFQQDFLDGFGGHDRINKAYLFFTTRAAKPEWENTRLNPGTLRYIAYYGDFEPSMAGATPQPDWTLDMADRFDSAALYDKDGKLLIASCDGIIRSQDPTNGDDDGDALQKEAIIRHGHMLMFEPGDDVQSGKKLQQFWMHVESESQAWTLYALGGDASAFLSVQPDNDFKFWRYVSPASAKSEVRTVDGVDFTFQFAPQSVHFFIPEKVAGRGFTFETRVTAPVGFNYRGVGGEWSAGGPAYRPPRAIQETPFYSLDFDWRIQGDVDFLEKPIFALGEQTGGTVIIEIRCKIQDIAATLGFPGTLALPVTCTLDFEGTNMPADTTADIVSLDPAFDGFVVVPVTFTGLDTTAAAGTLNLTAVDSNAKPSKDNPVVGDVDAAIWSQTVEEQIDGGGWTTVVGTVGPISTGSQTLELRSVLAGTFLPVKLEFRHADTNQTLVNPVSAVGPVGAHVEPYPGNGFGVYGATSLFQFPTTIGVLEQIFQNILIDYQA